MNLKKLTLLLGSTLTVMSGATISPSLPEIQSYFGDVKNVELLTRLVLTMPALFIAIGAPLSGYIIDKVGRLWILGVSLLVYAFAGTAPLYLDSLMGVIISRGLLGISIAGIMPTLTTLIGDYFEGEDRQQMMGLQSAFMAFGGLVFVSSGGFLADIGWRWPFTLYAFSIILIPAVIFVLSEPKNEQEEEIAEQNGKSLTTQRIVFVGLIYLLAHFFMLVFYLIPVQLPFYFKEIGVESNTKIGLALAAFTFMGGLSALFYRRIKRKVSYEQVYFVLFFISAASYFILSQTNSYWVIIISLFVGGMGFGLFMPNVKTHLMNAIPFSLRGRLMSGLTTVIFLGQFLSPVISRPLIEAYSLASTYMISAIMLGVIGVVYFVYWIWHRV
jgi:MFS family permease